MTHPLAQFLKDEGLTQGDLADRAGLDRTVITKVLSGDRKRFSAEAALRIHKATKQKLGLDKILFVNRST